jgi:hypothetical protein
MLIINQLVGRSSTLLVALVLLLPGAAGCARLGGCGKDSDCKGERTCVQGECVSPTPIGGQQLGIIQAAKTGTVTPPPAFKHAIVRASPALDAPEVAQLPTGTKVDLVDTSADTRWFQIRCAALGDRTAWIHRDVIRTP